jgi:1-acyl-sn-glycerol-3-phosphate acyltransferase
MFIVHLIRGFVNFLLFVLGSLEVKGWENVPGKGPYIMAVNHLSKADPPLILITWPLEGMRFFAGEKWEKHWIFGPAMRATGAIYINRGQVDRRALREGLRALEQGSIFGLAPEGTRSRVGSLIEARDGTAYLATRAKVPIVPVGLVNTDVLFRNALRLRRTKMSMNIGRPIDLPDIGKRPKSSDLAAYTHLIMVHIARQLPKRYWGYYAGSPALRALLNDEDPWPHCLAAESVLDDR